MTILDAQPASPVPTMMSGHYSHHAQSTNDMENVWPNAYSTESLYSCAMSNAYSEAQTTMAPGSPAHVMPVPITHPAPLRNLRSKHWVKVQGLPFTTTIEDLTRFFASFNLSGADNIVLVMSGGRATGRAFVEFIDAEEAARACEALNRRYLDSRWLELRTVACRDVLRHLREVACAHENGSTLPAGVDSQLRTPTAFLPLPRTGNCLKLVGLPFGCTSEDIAAFLQPYHVRPGGVHFCIRKGRATGKCVVEMVDAIEVIKAVRTLHRQYLGDRYVEVYPARPCDLYCDAEDLKTSVHLCLPGCYNPHMLHTHMTPYRVIEDRTVIKGGYSTPEVHVVLSFPDQDIARAAQQYLCESLPDVFSAEIITEGDRAQFMQCGPAGLTNNQQQSFETAANEELISSPSTDAHIDSFEKNDAPSCRFVHQPYSLDRFADSDSEECLTRTWSSGECSANAFGCAKEEPAEQSRSQLLHTLIKSVSSRA